MMPAAPPPGFSAAGHFLHPCAVCGRDASFGTGVSLIRGRLGVWHCAEHRLGVSTKPTPAQPPKVAGHGSLF